MDVNQLTIGQCKEIFSMMAPAQKTQSRINAAMFGKDVIVRTYSAGVWFGQVAEKEGNEVILVNARRMWRWWAAESISLSAVAVHGICQEKSKIVAPVEMVWLEAIEIIPVTKTAFLSISGAPHVQAE
ncbi:hypothetical protein OUL59_003329 [Salmonella enterica subsp. enterica serovar Hato]|nr:hypothetical protein [Salmonella enterica]EHS8055967.1 hypothetical protein [Salmonella enterica subsp. enterica]EHW4299231.1 hypothetical protein [Salmonella enterica subsp. enterica serovar Agbeni]EIJ6121936.1 hypothetical protein [Salmonella enterica subsp. enterica serovar Rubislaw]EHS8060093.1 hypothetical protein [Salmonella enterica subsp. enterica]EHU7479573.1 hypothetical protein [Salmonella enterica]